MWADGTKFWYLHGEEYSRLGFWCKQLRGK